MNVRSIFLTALFFGFTQFVFGWGQIGHRVVGEVAQYRLTKKVDRKISNILNGYSLAEVSNWADNIKSNPKYDSLRPWHYVSIPDGMTYETSDKNPDGDIIKAIKSITKKLKKGGLSKEKEAEQLKLLVHFVGDLHQPLHVGRKDDKGGNTVKVEFFHESTNLHRVWDSDMINSKQYSYTELADLVIKFSDELEYVTSETVTQRAHEAMKYRGQIYDLPDDNKIGYEYRYKNWELLKKQLAKGGIFLAEILNDIYG